MDKTALRVDFTKQSMDFGSAIFQMRQGHMVQRASWNGQNQWLAIHNPNELSKMTLPYIYINTVQGDQVPWLASQTDMLAEDWQVVFFV